MTDLRIDKSIGTSSSSDIKCSSVSQALKILHAKIYPAVGDEVKYYNETAGCYYFGTVTKYKSIVSLVVKCEITGKERTEHDGNTAEVRRIPDAVQRSERGIFRQPASTGFMDSGDL